MPDIPFEYYSKYDNITNLIKYIESYGYKIRIKDASCGELPVVITLLEHKNKKKFCISAGSHPCLSIAIERTLTEFLQGFDIRKDTLPTIFEKYHDIDAIITSLFVQNVYIENQEYFDFLFKENSDYEFNPKLWDLNPNTTNKIMAKQLAEKVMNISGDIYIRNCTFLDFPTISLYVPKMTSTYTVSNKLLKMRRHFNNIIKCLQNKNAKDITVEDIYYTCEYGCLYNLNSSIREIFGAEMYLFIVLSAILLKDNDKIANALYFGIKQSEFLEEQNKNPLSNHNNLKALQEYYNLKFSNKSDKEIKSKIISEYDEKTLNKIKALTENVTLNKLIAMIKNNYEKYLNSRETNENKNKQKKLTVLREKLSKLYNNNPPEQEHFTDFLYE